MINRRKRMELEEKPTLLRDRSKGAQLLHSINKHWILIAMVLPAVSVLFITGFIGRWNEYMTVSVFMDEMPTLAYGLYLFAERSKNTKQTTLIS